MQNYKTRFHVDPFIATQGSKGKQRQGKTNIMEIPDLAMLTVVNKPKKQKTPLTRTNGRWRELRDCAVGWVR